MLALRRTLLTSRGPLLAVRSCSYLRSALASEIAHEAEVTAELESMATVMASLDSRFDISHAVGSSMVELTGTDGETSIQFNTEEKFVDEDEEVIVDDDGQEIEAATGIWFEVSVTPKAATDGDSLFFKCLAFDGATLVDDVKVVNVAEHADDENHYNGPKFEDLDEEVQEGIKSYLHQRGVNDKTAEFIQSFSAVKEQGDYTDFLKRFQALV